MPPEVKIYTLSTCIHCRNVKKLLDECRVTYESKDLDLLTMEEREQVLEELRKINPACTFPTIVINKKVIVGYRDKDIKEALGL